MHGTDAETFASWASDERFCEHAGWRLGAEPAEMLAFWAELIADPPAELLRLTATSGGEIVGYVDLHGSRAEERELGYVVGPSNRWGRGLGSAIAAAGVAHAFDVLHLDSIWAEALAANAPSVQILRALGMQETGIGSDETFLREPTHYIQFRLDRHDRMLPATPA